MMKAERDMNVRTDKMLLYRIIRGFFKPVFKVIFRPEIIGTENIPKTGRVIIAGNHKCALDPILVDISTKRIVKALGKKELHDGLFGFIFRNVGTIPVDLHKSSNPDALNAAVNALGHESAINVSPEAKRNYTDNLLLRFKYGAVSMAEKTGAPIVPYAITGEYILFSQNLKIVFGEPFYVSGELSAANELLYNKIAWLLRENMDKNELEKKRFVSFEEWENEHKKTS